MQSHCSVSGNPASARSFSLRHSIDLSKTIFHRHLGTSVRYPLTHRIEAILHSAVSLKQFSIQHCHRLTVLNDHFASMIIMTNMVDDPLIVELPFPTAKC
jgi:hypothetical protein